MIQLDENYQEFLKGTSVRYEMYVKEMATGSRTDINNYKSTHQFSESNTISIGFFGMGTCEFEIEKNTLTEGAFIQIIASTPDYPRISRPAGEAPLFGGIETDSPFYELYAAAKDKAEELGVIPVFSDNTTYELIDSNSLKLICTDVQITPTVYWEDIYHAGTLYHSIESEMGGIARFIHNNDIGSKTKWTDYYKHFAGKTSGKYRLYSYPDNSKSR